MATEDCHKRTLGTVWGDFTDIGETGSKREKALTKLLRCVPEKDYLKLKEQFHTQYKFFIEPHDNLGKVYPFLPASTMAVYLSPILEGLEFDRIIAVAAHELAHIVLEHNPSEFINEQEIQEIEAWNRVCEWGFEKEARDHVARRRVEEVVKIIIRPSIKPFSFPE
jgi:hypothetical protein